MALNLDQLDDEVVHDFAGNFLGGQVSNIAPNQLDQSQWAELINVGIARNGRGTTRRGTARIGSGVAGTGAFIQGLTYYDTITNSYLVAVNNAKLYAWQSPNWTHIATGWTGTDVSVPYSLAQGVNKLYWQDGIGRLQSWDGTTLVDEGAADTNTDPPRAAGSITWFTSRLIASKVASDPDGIYFSNFLNGAAGQWNRTTQQLRVGGGEGDPITGIVPWLDNNLVVLKKRSIWIVNCDPLASAAASGAVNVFEIKPVHKRIGCIAPRTAAQVGSDIFVLTDSGVRSIKRTLATETQSEVGSQALSEPIQDVIDRINQAYIHTAVGTFWNNHYLLALPLDNATSPNYVAVWNALANTWSGLWTGWTPTAFSRHVDSSVTKLAIGHNTGHVANWLDYVQPLSEVDATFEDQGVAIATSMKTRAFIFEDAVSPKSGLNVEFEFNGSVAPCTVTSIVDEAGTPSAFEGPFATILSMLTLPQTLPFTLPRAGIVRKAFDCQRPSIGQFREVQFVLSAAAGKLSVRNVKMSGFRDSLVIQTS